jgi:4-alpha-glucanotransferase
LGKSAYQFIDWLEEAKQQYWQVLPMGEIGPGNSPYMSSSAFAGNVLCIGLEELYEHGWITKENITKHIKFDAKHIDYSCVKSFRMKQLRQAAQGFLAMSATQQSLQKDFLSFCNAEKEWLDDYALFMTISERENWQDWNQWPPALVHRNPHAINQLRSEYAENIHFWKFCQWSFARQWMLLKNYANAKNISIIGDVPIFVSLQSADVWAHQELFELDENGHPLVVAGVPPDYFSETGQRWGNPLYFWAAHEQGGYLWWINRIKKSFQYYDYIRIDHFRGFVAYWEIQAESKDAVQGKWIPGPGEKLFQAIQKEFSSLPIIAEDLGIITPDVTELRDKFGLPGMRILQFAFSGDEHNPYLPHNYVANSVAYTGTHDNDTSLGWWMSLTEHSKTLVLNYLGQDGEAAIQWRMMEKLASSKANLVIFPMQDVIGLASEGRMNSPGKPDGNWEWRFTWDQISPETTGFLSRISILYERAAPAIRNLRSISSMAQG